MNKAEMLANKFLEIITERGRRLEAKLLNTDKPINSSFLKYLKSHKKTAILGCISLLYIGYTVVINEADKFQKAKQLWSGGNPQVEIRDKLIDELESDKKELESDKKDKHTLIAGRAKEEAENLNPFEEIPRCEIKDGVVSCNRPRIKDPDALVFEAPIMDNDNDYYPLDMKVQIAKKATEIAIDKVPDAQVVITDAATGKSTPLNKGESVRIPDPDGASFEISREGWAIDWIEDYRQEEERALKVLGTLLSNQKAIKELKNIILSNENISTIAGTEEYAANNEKLFDRLRREIPVNDVDREVLLISLRLMLTEDNWMQHVKECYANNKPEEKPCKRNHGIDLVHVY